MLLRFGVANHRSIRDYRELLLTASKHVKKPRLTFPVPTSREHVVPAVAIYGPNASGKSNLIDALDELRRHIRSSHTGLESGQSIPRQPFRLNVNRDLPTRFDCTVACKETDQDESAPVFEYGFEFTDEMYQREWLYRTVRRERQSTQVVFERRTEENQAVVDFGSHLRGEHRTIARLTRPNSLFLSAAAQNNHGQLRMLYRYFASRWRVILGDPLLEEHRVAELLNQHAKRDSLLHLIRQADLGIVDFDIQSAPPDENALELAREIIELGPRKHGDSESGVSVKEQTLEAMRQQKRIRLLHAFGSEGAQGFEYNAESKGTRTLISLLIPAMKSLAEGGALVVDELDTSLHPNLARALVGLFTHQRSNPRGAQILFSTHDVTLLGSGLLHKDQIWMSEKDGAGASSFQPLTDYKLRSRDDVEKAYRQGRFGGVPENDEFFVDLAPEWAVDDN